MIFFFLKMNESNVKTSTHLVLMEGVRDVVGHISSWVRQNDGHVGARGSRRSQPFGLSLDERGQSVSAEFVFSLAQTWGHLT